MVAEHPWFLHSFTIDVWFKVYPDSWAGTLFNKADANNGLVTTLINGCLVPADPAPTNGGARRCFETDVNAGAAVLRT